MSTTGESPIKDKPLRHAGQSLEEERRALFEDKLAPDLLIAIFSVLLAALEWWRYYKDLKPSPVLFSIGAALAVVWGAWRVVRIRPKLRALHLGIEGEKVVGQYLERLRATGYVVFHDVVGEGFNVDHVLVGPCSYRGFSLAR